MAIRSVTGRMILDSRGVPTVEATVVTDKAAGTAAVPSGASTGSHEALELRDGDQRWNGKGVSKAVSHVNVEIAGTLKGKDVTDQAALDKAMLALDGTPDKSRLGANAVLAVSLACLKAAAAAKGQPLWKYVAKSVKNADPVQLPVPLCNVINGGAHADNPLAVQEFMLVPHGFDRFGEALRAVSETFQQLKKTLKSRGLSTGVGDEGGFAPNLDSHTAALDLLVAAISEAGYQPGKQISLALDVAASEFLKDGSYIYEGQPLSADQLVALYASWLDNYPIISLEDPLGEDDWEGWEHLRKRLGQRLQLVGDDLTVTNVSRIREALDREVINASIIKLNQIGTYTETLAARDTLLAGGSQTIISHRSGETVDDTIADLAVAWGASQIKTGSVSRGERVTKYNRLLEIEAVLGGSAVYAGPLVTKLASHG